MSLFEPKFHYPNGKENGFQERIPWTDKQCILLCLENCMDLAGQDKRQIERIIKTMMEPRKFFANRLLRDDFDPEKVTCSIDDKEVDCANLGDDDMEYPAL